MYYTSFYHNIRTFHLISGECYRSSFYIKTQLWSKAECNTVCCIASSFYIKPQQKKEENKKLIAKYEKLIASVWKRPLKEVDQDLCPPKVKRVVIKSLQELLENIPLEHMQLTSDIISYAIKNLNVQLNQNIYITLTDHINFAIQRQSQGIQLKNALLWETKKFYHQEYLMGKYAVDLLNEKLGTEFTEDEAGFIALHFVNAEYNTTINDTFEMTNMIQKILELVRLEMGIEFDEESLHYERFITHLKFLVQRLYRHELLKDEEIEFARMMENKYPKEYECSKHIAEYIEKEYGSGIASEEIMFLAIHIKRVCMAG